MDEDSNATCGYGSCGQDGALRLFSIEKLLCASSPASINLYEWHDLAFRPCREIWSSEGPAYLPGMPSYAAISHVWEGSVAAKRRSMSAKRRLMIDTGHDEPHEVSWLGLVQAATAARKLSCKYLWLDFLCLDLLSPADKKLQIKNMHRIYSNATAVIVMFGGVAAAQPLDELSTWINRVWTLQEATLCYETWGLVEWRCKASWQRDRTVHGLGDDEIRITKLEGTWEL